MYSTGSAFAFVVNMSLVYLNVLPPLYSGSTSESATAFAVIFLEAVNAMMPLVAVALDKPVKAIITAMAYVFIGLFVWTANYETATRGF
jgi:hypothetical protein